MVKDSIIAIKETIERKLKEDEIKAQREKQVKEDKEAEEARAAEAMRQRVRDIERETKERQESLLGKAKGSRSQSEPKKV